MKKLICLLLALSLTVYGLTYIESDSDTPPDISEVKEYVLEKLDKLEDWLGKTLSEHDDFADGAG